MNTLKPLLVIAILAGIGYGAYTRINSGPTSPPPGMPEGWDAGPNVQVTPGAPATGGGWPTAVPPATASLAPSYGAPAATATIAPPYTDPAAPASAPPFTSPDPNSAIAPPQPAPVAAPPAGVSTEPYASAAPPVPATASGAVQADPTQASPAQYAASIPEALRNQAASSDAGASATFATTLDSARRELEAGHLPEAHRQLSQWYDDPRLSQPEQEQLNEMLDQVAGTVIYSTQSVLDAPHEVQQGERLEDIGRLYNVPWQLLAKINGIEDPQNLRAGERLKIVRGPFTATVSLDKRVLTLWLNGLYAGRFAVGLGRDIPAGEGEFSVTDKVSNPTYHGLDRTMEADDPNNPLGERWISLDSPNLKMGIHGTKDAANVRNADLPGSICLGPRDAEDVYDILSVGSKVVVRR